MCRLCSYLLQLLLQQLSLLLLLLLLDQEVTLQLLQGTHCGLVLFSLLTHLHVQQGTVLQTLVEQTHASDCVAADAVGVVVGAEQQAAQQGGGFKAGGSLSLQHGGGGGHVSGLGQKHTGRGSACWLFYAGRVRPLTTSVGDSKSSTDRKSATKAAQPRQVKSSEKAGGDARMVVHTNF